VAPPLPPGEELIIILIYAMDHGQLDH